MWAHSKQLLTGSKICRGNVSFPLCEPSKSCYSDGSTGRCSRHPRCCVNTAGITPNKLSPLTDLPFRNAKHHKHNGGICLRWAGETAGSRTVLSGPVYGKMFYKMSWKYNANCNCFLKEAILPLFMQPPICFPLMQYKVTVTLDPIPECTLDWIPVHHT